MSIAELDFSTVPDTWTRRHLLGLEDLSAEEINLALDTAEAFKRATNGCR